MFDVRILKKFWFYWVRDKRYTSDAYIGTLTINVFPYP